MKARMDLYRPVDSKGRLAYQSGRPVVGLAIDEDLVLELAGPDAAVQRILDLGAMPVLDPGAGEDDGALSWWSPGEDVPATLFQDVTWAVVVKATGEVGFTSEGTGGPDDVEEGEDE